ncbi:MAG: hypothetical protein LBR10_02455 [Prevotellaceae bacterium]|jgi:hypothetical protein|nr:hypothetical protein [Prevotellaceae bacterium]
MALFIFYTDEGYTISPNGSEMENLQIIGIEYGATQKEALTNLYKDNTWIEAAGFSKDRLKCYAIFKPDYVENLRKVIDYLWEDEEKHFEESGCPNDHIFLLLKNLKYIRNMGQLERI